MPFRHPVEFNVTLNGIADIFDGLHHGRALGMTARQFRATDRNALRMFQQRDVVFLLHLEVA